MAATVQSIISTGSGGSLVDIECHLSNNLPNIVIVGSVSKAVDESRERIRGAFATSHIMLPRKRITVNLAPADIPKADSGFDLAIAVAIMLADGQVYNDINHKQAYIGELGLDGSVRAVRGIIGKILAGRSLGITTFFIPKANLGQAQLVPKVTLLPIENLQQLHNYLSIGLPIRPVNTGNGKYIQTSISNQDGIQISEIVGQTLAKRALLIAAAGGHNLFFDGPPGTGKSMLAKALRSILPPPSREEILEITQLHSLASQDYDRIVESRPFRSPHHTASHIALLGGGTPIRPGEISLAHRGVLFMDEFPEFNRDTIEALRQPLEDKSISVVRINQQTEFPANFMLVATANPCPCGLKEPGQGCKQCPPFQVTAYRNRMSGPIMDRIDLFCGVSKVEHDQLLKQDPDPAYDESVRQDIIRVRAIQSKRFGGSSKLNSDMTNEEVKKLALLNAGSIKILNNAARRHNFSARVYMRAAKVARTIADLERSKYIQKEHITDAIFYIKGSHKEEK